MKYFIAASLLATAALVLVGALPTVTMAAESARPAAKAEKAESYGKTEKAEKTAAVTRLRRHTLSGVISAIEPSAKTLEVKAKEEGGKELTLGLSVTDHTRIHEGKAKKTLADLKVGDHVRVRYARGHSGDVARTISVLSEAK